MTPALQLLLLLSIIIVAAKTAGSLVSRMGMPAVFGEIFVGLLLGPTVVNMMGWGFFHTGAGHGHVAMGEVIHLLAEIGVIMLMFVAGLETDLNEIKRVGKTAFWAAMGGVALPMGAGIVICRAFGLGWSESVFIGTILTATSVSISAQTLMELGSLRSTEGATILGAAVIDDVLGIIVLSVVVAFQLKESSSGLLDILAVVGRMTAFFVIAWVLGRRYLQKATEWIVRRVPASQILLAFVLVVTFMYAWAAEYLGLVAMITGSYLAGVLFAQTKFHDEIDRGIHPITYSWLVPVFFISIGLQANGRELGGAIVFLLLIVGAAILSKVLGCFVGARATGFSSIQSYRVGVGMISRGEVGLIVAGYGLSHAIITRDVFSAMVVMVLATTLVTPIWLRLVFPRKPVGIERSVYESVVQIEDDEDQRGR
jgi:Kef-type K+ transport system membrane component KefB